VREAGDSALLLELGTGSAAQRVIDREVNRRVIAAAAIVREGAIPGVRDVVSTFASVAVFFDPLSTDVAAVAALLHQAAGQGAGVQDQGSGRVIEVPVVYGGEFGPDLDAVASLAGCSADTVVDRHAGRAYRVFMLGFLPGFAYMADVDSTIAAPRRATPRLRVPAGSVGIAGPQTAVYPRDSPGGWQIIGRTSLDVFDANRTPPALFAPGDTVRFVPVAATNAGTGERNVGAGFSRLEGGRLKAAPTYERFITVLRPGIFTTIQDSGRWGYQHLGVSVSGAMDGLSHRAANAAVGNSRDAATLEATLAGPEVRIEEDTTIAIAGADLQPTVDGSEVRSQTPVRCRAGSLLQFGARRAGARAYIAFEGGVSVPPVLGSRATHVLSGLGGTGGRALKAGDRIPLGVVRAATRAAPASRQVGSGSVPARGGGARLRVLPGPQVDHFAEDALDALQRSRYTVSPQSDRMGYRLGGGGPLTRASAADMISDVTFPGGIQVPPSNDPILLMADRQTTGGYPQIAIVITADIPLAAQLAPGDWVEFQLCSRADAISALISQEARLLALR
jgi:KipI family sensor histidine kinase inhibitor